MVTASREWAFLSNHGAALVYLVTYPDSTIAHLALAVGVSERTAVRLARDLRAGGYLIATRAGRRNSYIVDLGRAPPDDVIAHCTTRDFLAGLVPAERLRIGSASGEAAAPGSAGACEAQPPEHTPPTIAGPCRRAKAR